MRGGGGERRTCSWRVPFADGELRPGNWTVCPESEKEVVAESRQQLSSFLLKTETRFLAISFYERWNTEPEGWLRNGCFIDQEYLLQKSCCPWFCSYIVILQEWGLLFCHPGTSVHLTHLTSTVCEFFCLDSSCRSNHRYCSNKLKSWESVWSIQIPEDKIMGWTKRACAGMPKTDRAPTELNIIQIFRYRFRVTLAFRHPAWDALGLIFKILMGAGNLRLFLGVCMLWNLWPYSGPYVVILSCAKQVD